MTTYSRTCPRCGTAFQTQIRNKKYCGPECSHGARQEAWRRRDANRVRVVSVERPCAVCGSLFLPGVHRRIYCSPTCREAGTREKARIRQRRRYRFCKRLSIYDSRHPQQRRRRYWRRIYLGRRPHRYWEAIWNKEKRDKSLRNFRLRARRKRHRDWRDYFIKLRRNVWIKKMREMDRLNQPEVSESPVPVQTSSL